MTTHLQFAGETRGATPPAAYRDCSRANLQREQLLSHFDQFGNPRRVTRNKEIYIEGDATDCWFRVVSGTVRVFKLLADGRRHISEFYFPEECFGLDSDEVRLYSAEAVTDVRLMRYSRVATERIVDGSPELARRMREMLLNDIAKGQLRMLRLGQLRAPEKVAAFLLDIGNRRNVTRAVELPMSRIDIADYLGLTIETVCRVLSAFKREGAIAIPSPHRIELRDLSILTMLGDA